MLSLSAGTAPRGLQAGDQASALVFGQATLGDVGAMTAPGAPRRVITALLTSQKASCPPPSGTSPRAAGPRLRAAASISDWKPGPPPEILQAAAASPCRRRRSAAGSWGCLHDLAFEVQRSGRPQLCRWSGRPGRSPGSRARQPAGLHLPVAARGQGDGGASWALARRFSPKNTAATMTGHKRTRQAGQSGSVGLGPRPGTCDHRGQGQGAQALVGHQTGLAPGWAGLR